MKQVNLTFTFDLAVPAPLDWLSGYRYNRRWVMHMTIQQVLREKGLSRYQLS